MHVVAHVRRLVLDEHAQRPRQHEQRREPEDDLRDVPRQALGVGERDGVLAEVDVDQVEALARLHVVVAQLVLREEVAALLLELALGLVTGERERLAEADLGGGELLEVHQPPRHVLQAAVAEVEGRAGAVRVDALVVDLRRDGRVAVAVARHLAAAAHVVVAHGLPPHHRQRLAHLRHAVVDGVDVDLVLQRDARVTVPALDEIHQVQHHHKRHRNVHVAVLVARTCSLVVDVIAVGAVSQSIRVDAVDGC